MELNQQESYQKPVARLIHERREFILSAWERRERKELAAAEFEGRSSLRDHIPAFMNYLAKALEYGLEEVKGDIMSFAHQHGSERALASKFSIEDALSEYNILRQVIFSVLEHELTVSPEERDVIYEAINFGLSQAASEYTKLQMRELEQEVLKQKILEGELTALFDLAGTGKAVVDPINQTIYRVNTSFCDMLGYSKEEILKLKLNSITHPEDLPENYDVLKVSPQKRRSLLALQRRFIRKDGSIFWGEVFLAPLPSLEGARFICTIIDINNRKKMELEKDRHTSQLRLITDTQPILIGQLDTNLNYVFVNKAYQDWYDIPIERLVGHSVEEILGQQSYELARPYLMQALEGKKVEFQMSMPYRHGKIRHVHCTYSPGFDEHGKVNAIYVSVQDISNLQELLQTQREYTARLHEEKILRDKFISALTHDLRTPLTTAALSAQLIPRKTKDPGLVNLSDRIVTSLRRVDKMIEDLLDANKLKVGKKIILSIQHLDVVELVRNTVDELETIYGERFVMDIPESLDAYLCPNGVRRVLENLCTNAIKYGSPSAPVSIGLKTEKEQVILSVHNFGNPLSMANSARLFDEYVRTNSAESSGKKGWGIGLSVVKGVVEAHGGSIKIESDDKGTLFKIILPQDARHTHHH